MLKNVLYWTAASIFSADPSKGKYSQKVILRSEAESQPSLSLCLLHFSELLYSYTVKMKAWVSSKTSATIYQTTWHHIEQTVIFTSTMCETQISCIFFNYNKSLYNDDLEYEASNLAVTHCNVLFILKRFHWT
jgi:hypothetical protein